MDWKYDDDDDVHLGAHVRVEDSFWELVLLLHPPEAGPLLLLLLCILYLVVSMLPAHFPVSVSQIRSAEIMDTNNHIWFLWVPEIRLRLSGLCGKHFYPLSSQPFPGFLFLNICIIILCNAVCLL